MVWILSNTFCLCAIIMQDKQIWLHDRSVLNQFRLIRNSRAPTRKIPPLYVKLQLDDCILLCTINLVYGLIFVGFCFGYKLRKCRQCQLCKYICNVHTLHSVSQLYLHTVSHTSAHNIIETHHQRND